MMEEWTEGLTVRSGNALKNNGFKSRDEVIRTLKSGSLIITGLGNKGVKEVRLWAGSPERDAPPPKGTLGWAISYCEDHGYIVSKPD